MRQVNFFTGAGMPSPPPRFPAANVSDARQERLRQTAPTVKSATSAVRLFALQAPSWPAVGETPAGYANPAHATLTPGLRGAGERSVNPVDSWTCVVWERSWKDAGLTALERAQRVLPTPFRPQMACT